MTPERWQVFVESLLRHARSLDPELVGGGADPPAQMTGRIVGSYEVRSLLGRGGMGCVYRAHDSKLDRDVALKIVPGLSALDAERLARLRREAQLLASLNHPNIAQIYGAEEEDDLYALVLELVDGPTLADRIAGGPLPIEEALAIARQIAEALAAAHDRSIVHRDLKPANIKIRPDGAVKVLDFGLAKALTSDADARDDVLVTARGAVLGTIAYMAPEQARGRPSDERADVWAFGAVLYEMIAGRSPFAGESMADTVSAVLGAEPDWTPIPRALQPLLRRCLEKDPGRRPASITIVRASLAPVTPDSPPRRRPAHRAATAAAAFAASLCLAAVAWLSAPSASVDLPARADLPAKADLPAEAGLPAKAGSHRWLPPSGGRTSSSRLEISAPASSTLGPFFVVSPDGRHLAFSATDGRGRRALWVHEIESGKSRLVPGARDVSSSSMIWAPDSRRLAFVDTRSVLHQVDIAGGEARPITSIRSGWGGATWNADDEIVFGQASGGLMRVAARGGVPVPLTRLDRDRGEIGHGGPRFLPDGRHFIYARSAQLNSDAAVYVGALDTAPDAQPAEPLIRTPSRPVYAPSQDPARGHVLLVADGVLFAYPFDARRLVVTGESVPIAQGVGLVMSGGNALISAVSASPTVLAYRRNGAAPIDLVLNWRDLLTYASTSGDRYDTAEADRSARVPRI